MGNNNGKTVSDKDKLLKKITGKTASDLDKSMIIRAYALARGVISPGKAISVNDFMAALKKIRNAKKKKGKTLERKYGGKLKYGGKAKARPRK